MLSRRVITWTLASAAFLLFCFGIAITNNPRAWRNSFQQKVTRIVPIGSTKTEFDRAAMNGELESVMLDMNGSQIVYCYWEVFRLWKTGFTVVVEPQVDKQGLITAYEVTSCAHLGSDRPVMQFP